MSRTSAYPRRQAVQSRPFAVLMVLLLVLLAGPALTADPVSAAPANGAGYVDFSYAGVPGADDLTAHHSQSKTWWHDGRWWAVMLDPALERWAIFSLDRATQGWTSTGVRVDKRNTSHADVLSDGNTLYVVSAYSKTATGPVGFFAYSYDAVGKKYVLKPGFAPVVSASGGIDTAAVGVSYATVAKDSAGTLWIAYTASNQVRYMTSAATSGGLTWSAPAAIPAGTHAPVAGAPGATPSSDDVASVVSFGGGRIGVMWSSSNLSSNGGFFFAVQGAAGWTVETAWAGVNVGDNHISVKAASDGRVIAVVKSSQEKEVNAAARPLIAVLERTTAGTWSPNIRNVSNVAQDATRPILVVDEGAAQANVFLTDKVGGGSILRRTAPLSTLNFGAPSPGSAFIKSSAHPNINDAASTKQSASAASGIVVLATDHARPVGAPVAGTYLHGCAGAACPGAVTPSSGSHYVPAPRQRLMSSQSIGPGGSFTLSIPSAPAGARAVALNVTAVNSTHSSTVSACKGGLSDTSCKLSPSVWVHPGKATAGLTIADLGAGNTVKFYNALGTSRVFADLQGWFVDDPGEALYWGALTTVRAVGGVTLGTGGTHTLTLPPSSIPAGTVAVALNVSAVGATRSTYISVCPGNTPTDTCNNMSDLNLTPGARATNVVIADLRHGGTVKFYNAGGTVAIGAQIQGWFTKTASVGTSAYQSVVPRRVISNLALGAAGSHTATITGLPPGTTAVALRLTAAIPTTATNVSVCRGGASTTACIQTPNLVTVKGLNTKSLAIVRLGPNNTVKFYNWSGSLRLYAEVVGAFSRG